MVIDTWRTGQYLLVTSRSIISEIKRVVEAPKIREKYGLSHDQIERLILLLEKDAIVVPGLSAVAGAIPRDPDDEIFLAAALDAKADIIVSGDRHLLDLGEYKDIPHLHCPAVFGTPRKAIGPRRRRPACIFYGY